jgi:hypothetical protein
VLISYSNDLPTVGKRLPHLRRSREGVSGVFDQDIREAGSERLFDILTPGDTLVVRWIDPLVGGQALELDGLASATQPAGGEPVRPDVNLAADAGMARPAGLMLFARNGTDRRLLSIAAAVERVLARIEVGATTQTGS